MHMFFVDWLSELMKFCYNISSSYVLSIIIFTAVTKIVLLPINIWTHMYSIKYVNLLPDVYNIKLLYYGDRDLINEKTLDIYKQKKYHPLLGAVPLILQFIILFGVIEAVNLQVNSIEDHSIFVSVGIDYSLIASDAGGIYMLFPIFAALSALIMCYTQNKSHVLQSQQGNFNKYSTMILSTALSLYLGFFVSGSVVIYWIASNLLSILQMYLLNIFINPKKRIDYDRLNRLREELDSMKHSGRKLTLVQRKKQRVDYKKSRRMG